MKKGYYSVSVAEKVAQCLWKTNLSSAKATISIIPTDGSEITTINTELAKTSEGYFQFTAAGFHFSANKISLKLIPEVAPTEPTPLTVKPIAAKPVVKKTITCSKGKSLKIVTSLNPKCPSGYRKIK